MFYLFLSIEVQGKPVLLIKGVVKGCLESNGCMFKPAMPLVLL